MELAAKKHRADALEPSPLLSPRVATTISKNRYHRFYPRPRCNSAPDPRVACNRPVSSLSIQGGSLSLSLSLFVQLIYAIRIVVVTIPKSFTYTIFPFPSYFFAPNATIAIERNPIFLLSLVEKEDGVEQMLRISQKNILPS